MVNMWLYWILFCVYKSLCAARTPNIINGQNVDVPGKYPWQGSLQRFNQHICGGSVIGDQWFLTAAHCVDGIKIGQLSVVLGMHDQSQRFGDPTRYSVQSVTMHNRYKEGAGTYPQDIALIKLSSSIPANNKFIQSITLDRTGAYNDDSECTISGWGYTEEGGTGSPNILQETDTEIITNEDCSQRWGAESIYPGIVCLYSGVSGGCMGDSGGPLQCRNPNKDAADGYDAWNLVGVTSWGSETCTVTMPSIYTRVSCFIEWIDDVMAGNDGTQTGSCVPQEEVDNGDSHTDGDSTTDSNCPEDFTYLSDRCYRIYGGRSTIADARQLCKSIGSELITLESEDEFKIIQKWLQGDFTGKVPKPWYDLWVDAECRSKNWTVNSDCPGGFRWASGTQEDSDIPSTMWSSQRPRLYAFTTRPTPDSAAFWRYGDWKLDNRPGQYKKGLALCKSLPIHNDGNDTELPPTITTPKCEDQNAHCTEFSDSILTAGCAHGLKDICCNTCQNHTSK